MSGFLHGIETFDLVVGGRQVRVVKSAVVMLVGFAVKGDRQKLILVQKDSDISQFGSALNGFTIRKALEDIFAQGAGTVVVNNVYDPATHDEQVSAESKVITNRKIKTTYHPTTSVAVTNSGGTTTYVKDTDYTIDDFGNIKIINPSLADGTTLKLTYDYFDVSTVVSSHIVGGITSGVRTGIKLFDECRAQFGFSGKILICPVYCAITAVTTAMIAYVANKRACTFFHAPFGTSIATAVTGRGPSGAINFKTTNKRAQPVFSYVKDFHPQTGEALLSEPTAYIAGVMCRVDSNEAEGPAASVSNHEIIGPVGTEITITDDINDQNSDMNQLNGNGIMSISMGAGAPYVWGNRNASYPENTGIDTFLCVVRTADIIAESIEYFSRPYLGKKITDVIIDSILDNVNNFLRSLKARGWIIDGNCTFDKNKNSAQQLADGHATFDYSFLPPAPLERLTYNAFIDIRFYNNLQVA